MTLLSDENLNYLTSRFNEELNQPVTIEFYTLGSYHLSQEELPDIDSETEILEEEACRVTYQMLQELAEISNGKLQLEIRDMETPEGVAAALISGVAAGMLPALTLQGEGVKGKSRYYGMPSGYEFGTLVENLITASSGKTELSRTTTAQLEALTDPVTITVFVTPT
jgi:hypothetical protein